MIPHSVHTFCILIKGSRKEIRQQRECTCSRVCECVCMREQRRDIDINRGQGRAGACFVIRAPLTSEVVNLRERCPDRASFEAISDFSRGSSSNTFCSFLISHPKKMPRADVILFPLPAGCAPVPPLTKRRIMLNAIRYTTDTPGANLDDSYVCIRPTVIFLSP